MSSRDLPHGSGTGAADLRDEVRLRAWQGLTSEGVFVLLGFLVVADFALPAPVAIWFPLPALALAVNALSPGFLFGARHWVVRRRVYVPIALVVLVGFGLVAGGALLNPTPRSDQPLTMTCAARDLRRGTDPYTTFEPQCEARLGYHGPAATPLTNGPFAAVRNYPSDRQIATAMRSDQRTGSTQGFPPYGYPPEAALVLVPVAFSGWHLITLWTAALTAALLVLAWAPRPRPPLPLALWQLAGIGLVIAGFGWNPELVSYLLLCVAFARLSEHRLSPIALGLAMLTNQQAWLAAPVYIALTHHEPYWWRRTAWLAGVLTAGTVPWMIWDHSLLLQLWRFISLPVFPIGATVSQLLPHSAGYRLALAATFAGFIAMCTAVAWFSERWRWAMVPLVWLAFFFSWRAPLYYYDAVFWLSPAVLLGAMRSKRAANWLSSALSSGNKPQVAAPPRGR